MVKQIVLVPGFCEASMMLWPLRLRLSLDGFDASRFDDRCIFRNLKRSVDRFAETISDDGTGEPLALITHSLGDWVARQAIAQCEHHRVTRIVSIAPVMGALPMAKLGRIAGFGFVSEVSLMADELSASQNLQLPDTVKRLVIWARFDTVVPRVDDSQLATSEIHCVTATHLSVICQPNTYRLIHGFLRRPE